ncbi:MAG TPA: D-inositol-3-phosphate glycosyltransferase [Propionibacteriaceae bacterium]|jgi:D-inositol-3-phosphate glycosyltransferase|nr:D-inositol-3-phosphate glycosyltransferase [Propionibacteriaceae bacterium]
MSASVLYPQRVAMISMHTSPLATPGVGDAGGLNVYVREVAGRLGERGLKVDVFTRAAGEDRPPIVEVNEHTRVIHVPAGPAAPVAKEDLLDLVHTFGECLDNRIGRYDLIHSHYWLSGMVARGLKARHDIPIVHTMHTMARVKNSTLSEHQTSEPNDREHGEAAIVADADVLTANTPDEAAELQQHYGATTDQIRIVPPGVDLHTFHPCDQPQNRTQLGVDQEKEIILFVGRIQPLKAPDVLIRAVAELTENDPGRRDRLRLIIIGSPSGPDSEWSATLAPLARDLGVGDQVIFRPHSPRADLFRWYCVADVVGVPSYNESFGLVALEAQACGRPVVATDVGGLRHAVRDQVTGLLVPGQDVQGWATALGTLLDDEAERHRMGARAAAHASSFSWDNTAAATLAAYGVALDGSG